MTSGPVIAEVVPAALDGERLDRVVAIITGASRADAAVPAANTRMGSSDGPSGVGIR